MVQKKVLARTVSYDATNSAKTGALALGVPGDIYDNSPLRSHPFIADKARECGTWVPNFGLIINPKEYALMGGLAPSLTVQKGQCVTCATMGHFVVAMGVAAAGAKVAFDATTGKLSAAAEGATSVIEGARVIVPSTTADGVAVIEIG